MATHPKPYFSQNARSIKDSGEGKICLLHEAYREITGKQYIPDDQALGDCVGHAAAGGMTFLATADIFYRKEPEEVTSNSAVEPIYGGSRIEIGEGSIWGDGSQVVWAVEWLMKYGNIVRGVYGDYDLSKYNPALSSEFGDKGVPEALETVAKEHPLLKGTLATTVNEVRDALANGYPVVFGSAVGFNYGPENKCRNKCNPNGRDKDGFLTPCGKWGHAMVIIAVDAKYHRPGFLVLNSWGPDWLDGPTRHNQPPGSFWIDYKTMEMILGYDDTFILSGYQGFRRRSFNYNLL